eukprot:895287_1
MYFSSKSRLMVLVTFLVLPISKSAISSDSDGHTVAYRQATPPLSDSSVNYDIEDCSRESLNIMLLSTDRFIPVNNISISRLEFHSNKTPDAKATIVNKSGMNGYVAQCKGTAKIPFVNGNFIGGVLEDPQLFRVFCYDDKPSWAVVNRVDEDTSLSSYGSAECEHDVLGLSLSEVECIDEITAITDGENVTFSNIPSVFTRVEVEIERQNKSKGGYIELQHLSEDTWTVPAINSLTDSGNVVAPLKKFQMLLFDRENQLHRDAETQFVIIKAAPGYIYDPPTHPQIDVVNVVLRIIMFLAFLCWLMIVICVVRKKLAAD